MKRALLEAVADLLPGAFVFLAFWLGVGVFKGDPDWTDKAMQFVGVLAFLNATTNARKVRALERGER